MKKGFTMTHAANKTIRFATPLIAVAMFAGTSMVALAQTAQNSAPAASSMSMNPEQEQAFRDGQEALKMDTAAKRKIDATASHLYVHPPVKKEQREAYRATFRKGYEKAKQGS
jgi:hypothetical protein